MLHRLAIVLVLVLLAAQPALGQSRGAAPNPFGDGVRASTSHVTVESRISPETAAPGTTLTVTLDVTPRRTMHVYAPGKHDYQVVALVVDAVPWLRIDATRYPASQSYYFEPLDETVAVYSQPFRLRRDLTILDTAAARTALAGRSSVTIEGRLEYQACDDRVCYAPAKVPVRFEVGMDKK